MKLSKLADTLIGSEIIKLANEINDKIRQGKTIYNFTIGDFNPKIFPIPEDFESAIIEEYKNKKTNYPPSEGILALRQSVSKFIEKYQGLKYSDAEIVIASGGRPLLYSIYRTIVDAGDKVIYPVPSWNNNHYTHFVGGHHIALHTTPENNFMPTAAEIKPHLEGATLIAFCSPQNPTGTVFNKQQLSDICELIIQENSRRSEYDKKLYLIYDQMYWTLTFGDTDHYDPVTLHPEMRNYTIFIDGMSKSFAATGVRVGWALGPEHVMRKAKAITSHIGAWSPMAEQHAAAKYLLEYEKIERYLANYKSEIYQRLTAIYDGLMVLKAESFAIDAITPQAAIYLTLSFDLTGSTTPDGVRLTTQPEVTKYILEEAGLAIVPFSAFGSSPDSTWYRLSVGTCDKKEIPNMLAKLRVALGKLVDNG